MKKNAAKRRKKKITTGIIAAVTVLLVLGLTGTILYTKVFKNEVDRFFAKKITVIDAAGVSHEFTSEELAAEVNLDTFYNGITIDGQNVGGKSMEEVKAMFAETRGKTIDDMVDIQFQVENQMVPMKTEGLTLTSNIDEIIDEAYKCARTSNLEGDEGLKDRYEMMVQLQKTPKAFTSSYTIGTETVETLAHNALDSFNKESVEAKATGFDLETLTFIISDSQEGCSVNVDKAIEDVKAALASADYKVVIPVEVTKIEPKESAEYLRGYLGKITSSSSKTKDDYNRNVNINLICQKIDGLVLQPGESFNFNNFIGERTAEKGFKEAGGIYDGRTRKELGGGICQANTMIFHCVVKSDLQVDERNPHSWPSDYVDVGTDATVTWGGANFQFTNTSDYPLAIHAYYGDCWVTVEFYGRPLPDGQTIKFIGVENSRTAPNGVEYIADSSMAVGETSHDRSSHPAIDASGYKIWYDKDGNEIKREEAFHSNYRMIKSSVRVGTRAADGTIFKMDPATGAVSAPDGYVPPTPTPDPNVTVVPSDSETPPPTQSETQTPTESETPPPTQSETPAPTESETPAPTESETPAPTESETPAPTESETPAPTESETPAPTESETPAPTESETPAPTESETPAPSESEAPPPTGEAPADTEPSGDSEA